MMPKSALARRSITRIRVPFYRLAVSGALLVTAAVYLEAAFFDFVYDDFEQIVYNPGIKSWDLAIGYFKSHVWAQSGSVLPLYYRPVFMLWLRANHALFGLHPLYWHLAAVVLHLLSCLLLYFFVRRLTEDRWVAVVAVLLFGLHPAHLEAVAWISGATETLMAVLLFGSLLCHLKHRDSGETKTDRWHVASLILAFLAVLAKETAFVMPALVFSYEWIFRQLEGSRKVRLLSALRAATPYVLISLVFVVLRTLALKHLTPPHTTAGLDSVLLAWPKVIAFYGSHLLFPFRLSVFYKLVTVTHPGFQNFILPLILMSVGAATLCYGSLRSRVFAFLSVWGAIMLVPMLNVTLLYNVENVHDRYLYLPSAAFCVMLASLLARLKDIGSTGTALAGLMLIAAGYTFVTVSELKYWRNDYVLAQHGVTLSPGHAIAPQLLGNVYIRQQRVAEAIPFLVEALDAQPDNVDTLCSLGFCYSEMNALPLAEECVTRAVALNGAEPRAHLLLGIVRFKQKRLAEAEAEIRRGIELQHVSTGAMLFHYYLGNVLHAKGDVQGAIREYRLELLNDPAIDPAVATAQARIDQLAGQFRVPSQQYRQ
jgi:Flp pilus assembly protein TadD